MTVVERVNGCPGGVTRAALLAVGHTNTEINRAVQAQQIMCRIYAYVRPRGLKVEWFYSN